MAAAAATAAAAAARARELAIHTEKEARREARARAPAWGSQRNLRTSLGDDPLRKQASMHAGSAHVLPLRILRASRRPASSISLSLSPLTLSTHQTSGRRGSAHATAHAAPAPDTAVSRAPLARSDVMEQLEHGHGMCVGLAGGRDWYQKRDEE